MAQGIIVREVVKLKNSPAPQTLALNGTAATQSNALGTFEILVQSTVACFVLIDTNPTASAATGHFLPANTSRILSVDPGNKLSAFASSAGSLYISSTV